MTNRMAAASSPDRPRLLRYPQRSLKDLSCRAQQQRATGEGSSAEEMRVRNRMSRAMLPTLCKSQKRNQRRVVSLWLSLRPCLKLWSRCRRTARSSESSSSRHGTSILKSASWKCVLGLPNPAVETNEAKQTRVIRGTARRRRRERGHVHMAGKG